VRLGSLLGTTSLDRRRRLGEQPTSLEPERLAQTISDVRAAFGRCRDNTTTGMSFVAMGISVMTVGVAIWPSPVIATLVIAAGAWIAGVGWNIWVIYRGEVRKFTAIRDEWYEREGRE
jgi:hypothetical protein